MSVVVMVILVSMAPDQKDISSIGRHFDFGADRQHHLGRHMTER